MSQAARVGAGSSEGVATAVRYASHKALLKSLDVDRSRPHQPLLAHLLLGASGAECPLLPYLGRTSFADRKSYDTFKPSTRLPRGIFTSYIVQT